LEPVRVIKTNLQDTESALGWSGKLSELELVAEILRDTNAYSVILNTFQDTIYRMLLRQTGNSEIASELAQETFIRAYEKLNTFRGESTFSTWLIRIALNISNNFFSSKAYKETQRASGPVGTNFSKEVSTDGIEERLELLREFINELKPKHRSIVLLCALEKKSYEEAATILKIPVGTVRSRLHEARETLRKRFLREASDL